MCVQHFAAPQFGEVSVPELVRGNADSDPSGHLVPMGFPLSELGIASICKFAQITKLVGDPLRRANGVELLRMVENLPLGS